MNKDSFSYAGLWSLSRRELALWLVVVSALCAGGLVGRGSTTPAEGRVLVAGTAPQSRQAAVSGAWRLDLNRATEAELEMLPGIGPRRAQLIVQERRRRGAFGNVWELREVPGLSQSLIQRLEPLIKVNPARSTP